MNAFTYGSLMFSQVFEPLTSGTKYETKNVVLKKYGRRHVKNRFYPGIFASDNEEVKGILYVGISNQDMESLDNFQGDEYKKIVVKVIDEQGIQHEAIAYLYGDPSNLQQYEWKMEQFIEKYKNTFVKTHLQSKK